MARCPAHEEVLLYWLGTVTFTVELVGKVTLPAAIVKPFFPA
jgi:hypothetical protein